MINDNYETGVWEALSTEDMGRKQTAYEIAQLLVRSAWADPLRLN